jgi:hypothetical protein
VNASGVDTIYMKPGPGIALSNINLAAGTILQGTVQGPVTMHGAPGSMFVNNGASTASEVDASVFGRGTWTVSNQMEFGGNVGPQQTVEDSGHLTIDQPQSFAGKVDLNSSSSEIDLKGLANAGSYSFKNDMLSIWSGNRIIDTLRMHDGSPNGFVVEPDTAAGSLKIAAISDPNNPPIGLPVHQMA